MLNISVLFVNITHTHSKKYLTPKVKTYVIQLDVNFPSNLIT